MRRRYFDNERYSKKISNERASNTGSNVLIIFLGDTHSFLDDFKKQKELIERFKPEIVLSEQLQDIVLDSEIKYKKFFKKTLIEQYKLAYLCYKMKIKLVGMDLKNFGFDKELQNGMELQKLSRKQKMKLARILKKRVTLHIRKIKEYLHKTNAPLLVIVGTWHLRKGAPLRQFRNALFVYPSIKEKMMLGPGKGKVVYRENFIPYGKHDEAKILQQRTARSL